MYLIHQPTVNKILKTLFLPFREFVPAKYQFAVEGDVDVQLSPDKAIKVTGNITSPISRMLYWGGTSAFEPEEFKFFTQIIKNCKVMFDIGSNIGYYSLVAKRYNPSIKVVAFEPLPSVYDFLNKNIALNGFENVKTERIALSNETGNASFHVRINPRMKDAAQLPGDSSLDASQLDSATMVKVEVQTETLDNYVAQNLKAGEKIDFIKIDTEATEHLVFQGGAEVLKTHRPIIMCEVIKDKIQLELEKIFSQYDYRYYRIAGTKLQRYDHLVVDKPKEDYFLVPTEKAHLVDNL